MEQLLMEFVNTLDQALKKMQQQVDDGSGFSRLTISQFQYMDAIHRLENPAITELANHLQITKASVTLGIKRLIGLGYVEKFQSQEDRRVFHVHLTSAADRIIKARSMVLKEYGEFIRNSLTQEEARQFEKILAKLVAVFNQQ